MTEPEQGGASGSNGVSRWAAAGRVGGKRVSEDREHMRRIGRAGGLKRARDKEGMRAAGKRGGEVVRERYGRAHFQEAGRKGGRRKGAAGGTGVAHDSGAP